MPPCSVGEETTTIASAKAIVGRLFVGVVGDHAVVSSLLGLVRGNLRARVLHALAHNRHALLLPLLEVRHSVARLIHELALLIVFVVCGQLSTGKGHESLSLLGSSWRIYIQQRSVSLPSVLNLVVVLTFRPSRLGNRLGLARCLAGSLRHFGALAVLGGKLVEGLFGKLVK